MIIIVSGVACSGTVMMMNCLVAGGIKPFYCEKREQHHKDNDKSRGRKHNPGMYYEVGPENFMHFGFSRDVPEDNCVQINARGLAILVPGRDYKVIFMRRNYADLKNSFVRDFGQQEFDVHYPGQWPEPYMELVDAVKELMEARPDVDLQEFWYEDVLADPNGELERVARMGIPIDVISAASIVDSRYNHAAA